MSKRRLMLVGVLVGVLLAVVALVGTARSAQARVTWCLADLGPMATQAEDTDNVPQRVEEKKIKVPDKAVSKDKGGDNEHK